MSVAVVVFSPLFEIPAARMVLRSPVALQSVDPPLLFSPRTSSNRQFAHFLLLQNVGAVTFSFLVYFDFLEGLFKLLQPSVLSFFSGRGWNTEPGV